MFCLYIKFPLYIHLGVHKVSLLRVSIAVYRGDLSTAIKVESLNVLQYKIYIKKQLQETVHSTLILGCFYLLYVLYCNVSRVYCC